MKVLLSQWRPWADLTVSPQLRVDLAVKARAGLCIKGTDGYGLYGPNTWNIFKMWPYKGRSNDDLELLAKQYGVPVQMWCFPYLQYPAESANAISDAIARWNPTDVWLDIEGTYAKDWASNTGAFLRSLREVNVRYWLQSYRRPDLHPEIQWAKWLSYTDSSTGKYIIHGLGPQAYPIGSQDFVGDFKRMIDSHIPLLNSVNRSNIPWFPTLPTFAERGWMPTVEAMRTGIEYLFQRLGNLIGLNFWRDDFLFDTAWMAIKAYILSLKTLYPDVPVPPTPTLPVDEFVVKQVYPWMVKDGYDGPQPKM